MDKTFGTWVDVRSQFEIARSTQKKYRLSGEWPEGIFWHRLGKRKTVLNLTLIGVCGRLRDQPHQLEQAIAAYQSQLPENQKPAPKVGRPRKIQGVGNAAA